MNFFWSVALCFTWVILLVLALVQAIGYSDLRYRFEKTREVLGPSLAEALRQKELYDHDVKTGKSPWVEDLRVPLFLPVGILIRAAKLLRISDKPRS